MNTHSPVIVPPPSATLDTDGSGLYIHVPFCEQKCEYCDFYSLTQVDMIEHFVQALLIELELRAPEWAEDTFQTVFFGGGTPSLLSPAQMARIWQKIRDRYHIAPTAECSMEANPGTLNRDNLRAFREVGFNRLSLGVQSFNPEELQFLGRIHSVAAVLDNFANARRAGFDNINIDLMTAFPGITRASFAESLRQALVLMPEHIACYTLIFEPGTVFYKRMLRGELTPMADEEEAGYYQFAAEALGSHGYQQYEVSNFSLGKVHRCRHNLTYWQHRRYIGFGPSAHSFDGQSRFANQRSLLAYLKKLPARQLAEDFRETLSQEQLSFEYVFLNLRLREGVRLDTFRDKFGGDLADYYPQPIAKLLAAELINMDAQRMRLTKKGWMLADEIAAYF